MPANGNRHHALGDISMLYVSVLLRAAAEEGADGPQLARRFNLDSAALASPQARISIPRFMRLGHAAISETGNRALGLRMGALTRPVDAGLAGLAAETAAHVAQAMAVLVRYSRLTSHNSRGQPHLRPEQREVHFHSIRPYNPFNYFVVDSVLAAWTQLARTLTGRYDVLERVAIEYPSTGQDELFERWFLCPVEFGADSNHVRFKPAVWRQPGSQAHPAMHEHLCHLCDQELEKIERGWTMADRVRHLIPPLLRGETPSLEAVAMRLGLSPWTLQRHLADEGTGFRQLLDETRQQLALDYLRETDSSLSEIAWLLGFANPPAFHKAYRRWFGISPGEHRRTLRHSPQR
ncbi:AraC family transcriptional regulator [Marinobacter lutaoensis]|jgi:AraC-like DNA-binding protein|uniref:AraC family transcriptional regulator n=1 Tax=Marinobacter lutaoensis TaxID=135739 RepID=A0A1V2DSQ9_9GAMM|nr:AraC family transcriptional regulator [Marinobacter lutaoensis]ONF43745.1 AraC family transcriptional regulator [Marinobacter lutaoensis]